MKKNFTLLIAMLMAWIGFGFSASAADGDVFSFTYSYYSGQTMFARVLSEADMTAELIPNPDGVTVYNMTQSSMWITPQTANGYTIISVGDNAFKNARIGHPTNCSVGLSNGFTTIKADAFNGATRNGSIISVFRINAEVSDISPKAFRNNKIKWFDFRTDEHSVGYGNLNHILTNVEKTKLVAFPGNYVSVSGSAQLKTTALPSGNIATNYTIPSQIQTIGAYAFYGNSNLVTLNLGSVTTIEEEALVNMSALKTLTIPATVTSIAADAFTGSNKITSLTVKCEWNDGLANVVFDDAVYEALLDKVTWQCSDDSKALFKANVNWGRFFTGGGAPIDTYNITYSSMTNGAVTGPATADNGTAVTLTVTPNAHYELGILTVTDADNNPVSTTPGANGTYTFLMPASNVTVNATFTFIPDIYIMGQVNGNSWAGNLGASMTYDPSTHNYTATVTTAGEADGYSYFSFSRALGNDANNWPADGDRFGSVLDAAHTVNVGGNDNFDIGSADLNTALTMSNYGSTVAYRLPQGTWTITIANLLNDNPTTITVTGTWPETKVYMNYGGETHEMTAASGGGYTYNLVNAADVYFNFARKLNSGTMPLTYFGTSGNHDVLRTEIGTPITVAADGTLDYFKLPAGDWTITLSAADGESRTMTITGTWPAPADLYVIGDVPGTWNDLLDSNKFTYDAEKERLTYELEVPAGEEGSYSYFRLKDSNRQYGPEGNDDLEITEAMLGTTINLANNDSKAFKVATGETYTLTVDYDKTTLIVTTYDKSPFTDGKFYYQAINSSECEIIANPNGNKYSSASNVISASDFKATATNSREGKAYTVVGFGEASMTGEYFVNHDDTNIQCKIDENFSNYRYIKSRAFDGVYAATIRFYHVTEIAPDAFINNKAHGILAFVSGYFTNVYAGFSFPSEQISTIPVLGTDDGIKLLAFPGAARKNGQISSENGRTATINGIGGSIQEIAAYAFYGNQYIKSLTFGSSSVVTTIGDHTFENSKLVTLNLPASLTSIGEDAFKGVTTLRTISISAATPPTVTSEFEDAVYNNCTLNLSGAAAENEIAYMAHPIWGKFFKGATLANTLKQTIVADKGYKVADNLVVALADTEENVIYVADNNGAAVQTPQEGWLDYMASFYPGGQAYTEYAHNNWAAIRVSDASQYEVNGTISSVVGTINADTRTITAAVDPAPQNTVGDYGTLNTNTYIVAAFGGQSQTSAANGQTYFFVQPTMNELATVTWAQYDGEGRFIVPTGEGANGAGLTGELMVDLTTMNGDPVAGSIYKLTGVLVPNIPAQGSDAPRRAEGGTSLIMKNGTIGTDDLIITSVNDLKAASNVEEVKYIDVSGRVSDRPFQGLNIVVTRFTDGTMRTAKMVK